MLNQKVVDSVNRLEMELCSMSDAIFDRPELGLNEYYASDLLCSFLEKRGFRIERGIAGLATAFRAVWQSGDGGPSIGLLCEYDALEGLGHACGHHAQGPAILGAAAAVQEAFGGRPFRLVVYGTPAEETVGGKIIMLQAGCFRDIDTAFMVHLGPSTCVDDRSMAMNKYTVTFTGRSSHAALRPEEGRSALDGLLLMFQGIEFLREHVPDDVRMHYTVINAGGPANCVPEKASGSFYLRSYHQNYLADLSERFMNIAKGAALMTETHASVRLEKSLEGKVPVACLNELVMRWAQEAGAPEITPPRKKTGSTDFSSVQHIVPGTCLRIHFVPPGTASHSQQFLDAGKSLQAHRAIVLAAQILACAIGELIADPQLLRKAKEQLQKELNRFDDDSATA